ncbi:MAG TPA: metal ABC transporter substrate-binding protein [Dehalococcoidia bacterium]
MALLLVLLGALAAACSQGDGAAGERLRVVATIAPITSIVENVGGDRIDLQGLIPEGTNPRTFEPTPSDLRLLSRADLIVANGLNLEGPTLEQAESGKRQDARILRLGDSALREEPPIFDPAVPPESGTPNPYLWLDPHDAMAYARLVRDALVELDPENAPVYQANTDRYLARLAVLDRAIQEAVGTIPPEGRRLLTYHDFWAYFARRYGLEVISAVRLPDFSEPSPQDVERVIEQIRRERVPVVFGSEAFPSEVLQQIARETGAQYIDKLRGDDLPGKPGDPRHSYVGLMLENVEIMIPALGGRVDALAAVDPANVTTGNARYPQ